MAKKIVVFLSCGLLLLASCSPIPDEGINPRQNAVSSCDENGNCEEPPPPCDPCE